MERRNPTHLLVVFDPHGPTFRHELYPAYKANRVAMPESLVQQMGIIGETLDDMNVPRIVVDGVEADDVIATLATRWKNRADVRIVTGDKDLLQIVGGRVSVIRPARGRILEDDMGSDAVHEKLGVHPAQVIDYLALTGDSSDNVPGVRGIGPRTAVKLLDAWNTLGGVYEHIDEVRPPGVARKLKADRDNAWLSRELITLRCDVPVVARLEDYQRRDVRTDAFRERLENLEFGRMAQKLFGEDRGAGAGVPGAGGETPAPVAAPPSERGCDSPSLPEGGDPLADSALRDAPADYAVVSSRRSLQDLAAHLSKCDDIAVDTETSGLDPMRAVLAGISLASGPGKAWYVPVTSELPAADGELLPTRMAPGLGIDMVRETLGGVLAADRPAKVGQNIKYDEIVLKRVGLALGGVRFDTMVASYCLDPARRSHGLDALARDVCGHEMVPFASLFDRRTRVKDIRTVPLERVTGYACEDADYTLRIERVLRPMIEASVVGDLFEHVEMPLHEVLRGMEMTGVCIDLDFLAKLSERYATRIADLEGQIHALIGEEFNIQSTPKLQKVLFEKLGLKPARRTRTGYSTGADVLATLSGQHPVVDLILEFRRLTKLQGTYVDALPRLVHPQTGRVHTSFNQAIESTGRLSSSNPNLQNIPIRTQEGREIRRAFIPGDNSSVLLDADYSQIELRILAHLSDDPGLVQAFLDDDDIHRRTAARVLGIEPSEVTGEIRGRAKAVNFGIVYGQGARGLASSLGIPVDDARRFIADYFAGYPGVKRFIDGAIEKARATGVASTLLGRVRRVPDIQSTNGRMRSFSQRVAVNTPVQGTAADIIKLAMLEVDGAIRRRGLRSRMLLQVHDELLFEVPGEELDEMKQLVRTCMESAAVLSVPLKVDMGVGRNWLEAH